MPSIPRWLPNAISALRIALVPAWVWAAELTSRGALGHGPVVAILLAIGISDLVDGDLARRFGLTSRVGATLDAIADKLAQVVLVTWLALRSSPAFDPIPLWFLGLLIARDGVLLIGLLLLRARHGKVEVEHEFHGKAASVLLFVMLVVASAGHGRELTLPLLLAIALLVSWSTCRYVRRGFAQERAARRGDGSA
ncbi:MAG: CDP-alcohol phosphatidyltransferase family protein [Planctomycetes bacterium]|nr:CDP-alcohol phosphatidyltransferase family protein [Planctomycetota bacterium]